MARELRRTKYGLEFIGKVVESRSLTPTTHGLRVEKPPEFEFQPVQFTFVSMRGDGSWEDYRALSLACSPTKSYLEYGVRVSDSAWKQEFVALKPGDEVMVEGPVGHFILDDSRPAVFVAGGIGITPLKGMMESIVDRRLRTPFRLLYSNRSEEEIAYREELEALDPSILHTMTGAAPGWKGRRGRIDAAMLREVADGLDDPVYYVCGAPGLVEGVRKALGDAGVSKDDIRFEHFWGYEGRP